MAEQEPVGISDWKDDPVGHVSDWVDGDAPKKKQFKGLADYASSGWGKTAGEAIDTASNVLQKDLGNLVGMVPGKIGQMGKTFAESIPDKPKTLGGSIGDKVGGFMEYETAGRLPGVNKLVAGDKAGLAKRMAIGSARAGAEAGIAGTAQTGDLKQGAKQAEFGAIAAPVLHGLSYAVSPMLKKSAQHLYERFLIPGGGAGYNKEIAKDAAAKLIEEGHFAFTKPQFKQKMAQRLVDAESAIQTAENNMLETMGFAPTGESTWTRKSTPYTEHVGPTIDVDPISATPKSSATTTASAAAVPAGRPALGSGTELEGRTAVERSSNGTLGRASKPQRPLGGEEGSTRTGTKHTYERVAETKRGLLYVQGAIDKLKSMQREHFVGGQLIEGYGTIAAKRADLINQLESLKTKSGYMPADQAIKLRRSWDGLVKWERNPQTATLGGGVKEAFEDTANALRHEIGLQVKGMAEANAKYHFAANVNKVLNDKENQTVGHRALGLVGNLAAQGAGIVGFTHGGITEGAELYMALGALAHYADSGANLTGSAIAFNRLGDLMRKKQWGPVVNRIAAMMSPVARESRAVKKNDEGQ